MVFISATRLRLKSIFFIVNFQLSNHASAKQLVKTEGFLGGKELIDKHLTFWTLTMWDSEAAMKSFRNSIPHRKSMQKLPIWCDEASYMHWSQENESLPDWNTVHSKMMTEGKSSKVRNPSENQLTKNYPEIKWTKMQRIFEPHVASV